MIQCYETMEKCVMHKNLCFCVTSSNVCLSNKGKTFQKNGTETKLFISKKRFEQKKNNKVLLTNLTRSFITTYRDYPRMQNSVRRVWMSRQAAWWLIKLQQIICWLEPPCAASLCTRRTANHRNTNKPTQFLLSLITDQTNRSLGNIYS